MLKTKLNLFLKSLCIRTDFLKNSSQQPCLVLHPVQNFGDGVRKEAILSKEGVDGWFESRSLNTHLERRRSEYLSLEFATNNNYKRQRVVTYLK